MLEESGKRIKIRRKSLGISGYELAKIIGINKATIYRYENGDIEKVPTSIIKKLSEILQCTPEYLMCWSDDPNGFSERNELLREIVNDLNALEDDELKRVKKIIEAFLTK